MLVKYIYFTNELFDYYSVKKILSEISLLITTLPMTYVISSCELVTNSGEVGVIFCTFERGGGGNHGGPSGTAFTRTALGFTGTYFSAV